METALTDTTENLLLADLTMHERRVWNALVEGDMATDASLLSDSFLGVHTDGFANKSDHTGQLSDGPTVAHYALDTFHVRALGPDHALLSYRAEFQRRARAALEIMPEIMYVTSVWERSPKGWTNIFSQDTPA